MEFLAMTKPAEIKWQNTNGLSASPPLCSLSGLGAISQAEECRDAATGVLQVPQHTDVPHTAYQPPFPHWMHLGFPVCQRSYWLSVASGCFHPQRNWASIPLKSCPQGLSLSSQTHDCPPPPPGRPHEGSTWHPKAARRNPRTVGDAGAAPVTIIRTHPPRLACGTEGSAKVCASGSGV